MTATPTFSQTLAGVKVSHQSTNLEWDIPDADIAGNAAATREGMKNVMRQGGVFLAKGPDGKLELCRFADGSTYDNPKIIKASG